MLRALQRGLRAARGVFGWEAVDRASCAQYEPGLTKPLGWEARSTQVGSMIGHSKIRLRVSESIWVGSQKKYIANTAGAEAKENPQRSAGQSMGLA